MNLQQLRYLKAITDNGLNISAASKALFTSQPGISKQIGLLEKELGVRIFERKGKSLSGVTKHGKDIIDEAKKAVFIEEKIRSIALAQVNPQQGVLNLFTTHTIARHFLADIIDKFVANYPHVTFCLHSIAPNNELPKGASDFSILAHQPKPEADIITIPIYKWRLSAIVSKSHPLATNKKPTIKELLKYPWLTYELGSAGRDALQYATKTTKTRPRYLMSTMDAELIKTYAAKSLGVGFVAEIATKDLEKQNLTYINMDHLLPLCNAWVCFNRNVFLNDYIYDFLHSVAPHITKEKLEKVVLENDYEKVKHIFEHSNLPILT